MSVMSSPTLVCVPPSYLSISSTNRSRRGYSMSASAALQAISSWESVPPEQPIAPINLPLSISGRPPRDAMKPSSVIR